jgi:hypothetical protein
VTGKLIASCWGIPLFIIIGGVGETTIYFQIEERCGWKWIIKGLRR